MILELKLLAHHLKTIEVRIAEDGEILVKGENVMLGYWNNEIETEKVIKRWMVVYRRYWYI